MRRGAWHAPNQQVDAQLAKLEASQNAVEVDVGRLDEALAFGHAVVHRQEGDALGAELAHAGGNGRRGEPDGLRAPGRAANFLAEVARPSHMDAHPNIAEGMGRGGG